MVSFLVRERERERERMRAHAETHTHTHPALTVTGLVKTYLKAPSCHSRARDLASTDTCPWGSYSLAQGKATLTSLYRPAPATPATSK